MKNKEIKPEVKLAPTNRRTAPMRRAADLEPLAGFTPFSMMRRFTDDMERFFGDFNVFNLMPRFETDFGFPQMPEFKEAMWMPVIEVVEKKGELKVHAELPGLKKEDINVEFDNNALILSGERKNDIEEEKEGFYHTERSYGSFYRAIPLPEGVDINKTKAMFNDGVLEITVALPKAEPKAKKIEITDKPPIARAKAAG